MRRIGIRAAIGAIVFGAVCLGAMWAGQNQPNYAPRWWSIVPPLLAVTVALVSNRLFLSLIAAVVVGGLLSISPGSLQTLGAKFLYGAVANVDHLLILAYIIFILAMIAVVLAGGGLQGVAVWLARFARSARSTRLATVAMGLVIFIDDYANTMIVGSTMRPMTDRQRISREKLAFLVDATAAPIAGIALISTWVGYEVSQLAGVAKTLGIATDGYTMFFDALGFRFYCILMIAFVCFNAYFGSDFGPMARAERKTRKLGRLLDDDAFFPEDELPDSAKPHPAARVYASVAVVPMAVLFVFFIAEMWFTGGGGGHPIADVLRPSVWREVFGEANSTLLLVHASGLGLIVALVMVLFMSRIPASAAGRAVAAGVRGAMVPIGVLLLAWSLQGVCDDLGTGRFLANVLERVVSPMFFPAMVFIVAGLTAFGTGTSWGTMAIVIPTAVPVAFRLDGDLYGPVTILTIAAVLDGSIFGDHCSPISDTTVMSSTASHCDHLAHVRTQMPYSVVVALMAVCLGYLPSAMGASKWVGIGGGVVLSCLLFAGLKRWRSE